MTTNANVEVPAVIRKLQERISTLALEVAMWQVRVEELEGEVNALRLGVEEDS